METVFEKVFGPIARLAIAQGRRFADVAEDLRRATFDAALRVSGSGATDSKIAVLSGLQRRDVARLRAGAAPKQVARPDPLARIVSLWLADGAYGGRPIPQHGDAPSFDALAREVRKDVHPKSLLEPLIEAGTVAVEGTQVVLLTSAHVPRGGSDAQLDWLAGNVGDHLSAAVANVTGDRDFFEQAVAYHDLTEEAVAELDALWRAQMVAALEAVNARALALQDAERGQVRFRAGAYFYAEDER